MTYIEHLKHQDAGCWHELSIFFMLVVAAGVAGTGVCLWLAGFSGRRIAKS